MAETIINIVLRKLADAVVQEALSLYGVHDKVERVVRDLTWIQSFLRDADTNRDKDERVKKWVNEVQEVGYLIQDILEKFMMEVGGGRTDGIRNVLKRIGKMPMKLMAKHKLGNQLDKIQQRICEISENKQKYGIEGLKESCGGASVNQPIRPFVNPDIDDTEVVGFEVDRKIIVDQLIATNITRRAVISIVGAGGSGKTTLAKQVYKSIEVQRHFDISMWLTISQEYKLIDILMKMLEKIREVLASERQNKEEEYFIIELNKSMKEKKYLIILDDVWSVIVWSQLEAALPNTDNGSRVLITTRFIRIVEVADIISNPYKIKPLNEEESKQLLLRKVFPNRFANECPNEVLPLAIQFTKKCGGWPLPLVVVAGILSTKNPDYITWDEVMQKMDWQTDGSSFMGVISTSYEDLPATLKRCFMYFGAFPEDYQINTTTLIPLWIAEEFIQQDGTKFLEDIAESYLEELVQRCMVQVSRRSCIGKIKYCQIHDLLRDLAIKKAKEDNFLIVVTKDDTKLSCGTCAHRIALHGYGDKMIEYPSSKNLRSSINFQNVPNIQKSKTLRILHMSTLRDRSLYGTNCMKGLNSLTTLKYFGFQCHHRDHQLYCSFPIVRFKRSPLTNMMNLQTVCTWLCKSQVTLPPNFWGNKQLRHINLFCCPYCQAAPEGPPSAADLQSLLTLKGVKPRQEWVVELPNFPNIRKLGIIIPEDFEREPLINMLSNLNHLGSLYLYMGMVYVMKFPDCISAFRNHSRLHTVNIKFGIWPRKEVVDCTLFPPHLAKITLRCFNFEEDPMPQLEKLPKLRVLKIADSFLYAVNGKSQITCSRGGFACLKQLDLAVHNLTEWKIEEGAMPMLNQLYLYCSGLQIVPDLQYLVNLQEFDVFCSYMIQSRMQEGWNIKHIPSVKFNSYK